MKSPKILAPLFPGVAWEQFSSEYWPHNPLYRNGALARMKGLEDLFTLPGVVSVALHSQMELKAILSARLEAHNEISVSAGDIIALLDSGATIACNALHLWHNGVQRWTEVLAQSLTGTRQLGVCNLYITPGGRGVPMHFDDHEIIIVQLAGRKSWNFARNTQVVNPTGNSGRILTNDVREYAVGSMLEAMPKPSKRVKMLPGSILFLPRGYWHETDATELSISITFGFRTPCWAELVTGYLGRKLVLDSKWREPAWDIFREASRKNSLEQRWQARMSGLEKSVRRITVNDLGDGITNTKIGSTTERSARPGATRKRNKR